VKIFEIQLRWERVALRRPVTPTSPSDPAYRWDPAVDEAVRQAGNSGIKVAIMVTGSPAWANGGQSSEWAPLSVSDYTNFLIAAARRYPGVRHWMIWGEPVLHSRWKPLPLHRPAGPRRYAKLLDASYATLKHRNRHNVVIGGGTVTYGDVPPTIFLRFMKLPNGRPPRLDWFMHNPYSRRFPDLRKHAPFPNVRDFSDVDVFSGEVAGTYERWARKHRHRGSRAVRRYFRRFRHSGPPLWLSEFTISTDRANSAFSFFVSRKAQARWITAAYRIARGHGYIAGLGWFNLQDGSGPNGLTTGLLTASGAKKPGYFAYRRAR